jgi:phosphoglycolate phosphatase
MPLRAILFDKDGTLVDFHLTWSRAVYAVMDRMTAGDAVKLAALAAANHYDMDERRILPTSPLVAHSSADYGVTWAQILGEEPNAAFFTRMDTLLIEEGLDHVTPIGDPRALLASLKAQGFFLGICTNDSEAGARAQCDRLGVTDLLDAIIGYDSGHGRKPDAGPILAFAKAHGVEPHETALVGDSLHDLLAVRAAGGVAIAVLSGLAGREELAGDADHVVASIMDLPELFAGLGA